MVGPKPQSEQPTLLRLEIDAESMSDEERKGGRGRAASCARIARKGRARSSVSAPKSEPGVCCGNLKASHY